MKKPYLIIIVAAVAGLGVLGFIKFRNQDTQIEQPENTQKNREIGTDICAAFTKEFVGGVIGKTIEKTESHTGGGSYNCEYYFDEKYFVSLTLNNLSVENQKKGAAALDRKIETSKLIEMEHFMTVQEDGTINAIYLVRGPIQYIRVDRSSVKSLDNSGLINLASKVADRL